jgi:hypothetical protein
MRWEQGRSTVDAMLTARDLERVPPSAEHAAGLLSQARKHIASARRIAEDDPAGAFQLLYDAARKALWRSWKIRDSGRRAGAATSRCSRRCQPSSIRRWANPAPV